MGRETSRDAANGRETGGNPETVRDDSGPPVPEGADPIEAGLARALVDAAADQRWDIVAQLAAGRGAAPRVVLT